MPKRKGDWGVWRVFSSSEEDMEATANGAAPPPETIASAPTHCPRPLCDTCKLDVPFDMHNNYDEIFRCYVAKHDKLKNETALSPEEKCEQSVILNVVLASIESDLFENNHIDVTTVLHPTMQLRSYAGNGSQGWGMSFRAHAIPFAHAAAAPVADGQAASSAPRDAAGSGGGGGGGSGKKRSGAKKLQTLEKLEAYTPAEWQVWDNDPQTRARWENVPHLFEYEVKVECDEGLVPYGEPYNSQLLRSYFAGDRRFELIDVMMPNGHRHNYIVYWLTGQEGRQFNPVHSQNGGRKVMVFRTTRPTRPTWTEAPRTPDWSSSWEEPGLSSTGWGQSSPSGGNW